MGRFERAIADLETLSEVEREELASILEKLPHLDLSGQKQLSDAQADEVRRRLANPSPIASPERVAGVLAKFKV